MQAIQVKYLAPTNTKGSRFKAFCSGGSITRSRDYELEVNDNMANVAWELANKLGWSGEFRGGTLPNGDMVWVMGNENYFIATQTL